MNNKKNVIIITLGYYPDMSPVSALIDKYIQELRGSCHFHIIALPTRLNIDNFIDPDIDVYHMNDYWQRLLLKYGERIKEHPSLIDKTMFQALKVRGFMLGLKEPYSSLKWMKKSAFNILENISKTIRVDAVISISGAFLYLHEAAKLFKEVHPQVKWITFVTDPISFSSLDYKRFRINEKKRFLLSYKKEKNIYDSADYNIFTENLYYDAIEKFHQPKDKTIQFKFVLKNLKKIHSPVPARINEDTKLIYAGALYRVIRNPEYMLSVISKVPNVHLDMFVRSFECMNILKKYESDKITVHDGVDVKKYIEMICDEYDILINIGNNCDNQLPSKTLELLSSGRPIINFFCHKDSQYEMIEKYPLGLNVGRDETDAVTKVESFCNAMRGKQLSFEEVERLFPENSMDYQKKILESLLEI